jgi:hypothetical protein
MDTGDLEKSLKQSHNLARDPSSKFKPTSNKSIVFTMPELVQKEKYEASSPDPKQNVKFKSSKLIKSFSNMASSDMLTLSSNKLRKVAESGGSILKIGISAGKSIKVLNNLITQTHKTKDMRTF